MTLFAFALNCFLALLLLAAMMVGLRLERRLKGMRDSHEGFARAAADLNLAIARAEGGLAEMRAALKDAEETLTERVDEARAAAKKLEAAMQRAQTLPASRMDAVVAASVAPVATTVAPQVEPVAASVAPVADEELPIRELLAKLRSAIPPEDRGEAQVLDLRQRAEPAAAARSRARVDDELFEADERAFRRAGLGR
jgi:hypothetical protein